MPIISTRPRLGITTALCCDCGTQRQTTTTGGTGDVDPLGPTHLEQVLSGVVSDRCTVQRKCATCSAVTTHAYLRTDVFRDFCEERQYELHRDGVSPAAWDRYRLGYGLER